MGEGEPVLGEPTEWSDGQPVVWFNGNADENLDHETLAIRKGDTKWSFCNTARKPYDLFVCAVLLAARDYLGFEVSSDGDLEDWMPAIKFYISTIYAEPPVGIENIVPEGFMEEMSVDELTKLFEESI